MRNPFHFHVGENPAGEQQDKCILWIFVLNDFDISITSSGEQPL
jgi:hypothetical protein